MSASFQKAQIWFLFMTCLIVGIKTLIAMKAAHYMFYALVAFGGCLMFANVWKSLSKQGLFISLVVALALTWASNVIPREFIAAVLDTRYVIKHHEVWIALNLFIGVPVMTFIFHKFED